MNLACHDVTTKAESGDDELSPVSKAAPTESTVASGENDMDNVAVVSNN